MSSARYTYYIEGDGRKEFRTFVAAIYYSITISELRVILPMLQMLKIKQSVIVSNSRRKKSCNHWKSYT